MILKGKDGIYHVERTQYNQTAERQKYYDRKFGKGNWKYVEPICSYLCKECGYGESLNKDTCRYCDGKCVRPKGGN